MTEEEKAAVRQKGVEARQHRARARADAVESSRKGLQALMGERLEAEADVFVQRLRDLALHPDPAVALQGMKLWVERVYGRAVQPTADVTEDRNPLVDAFAALSPEERRQLLRLAQPLPSDTPRAQAEGS